MARRRRKLSNQGAYHAYNRAESGAPIFESDEAKQVFLEIILSAAMRFSWQVHAYAIMTNHFHLMVTTPLGNLSQGKAHGVGRPMGSGRTPTQPEPKTVSFRRISVQHSKGTA